MGKIKSKPNMTYRLKGWKELQIELDMIFNHKNIQDKKVTGKFSKFEMSREEIVSELEEAGYSVEVNGDDFIVR